MATMRLWQRTTIVMVALAASCLPARADIGLLLNAKLNGRGQMILGESLTGEGHSSVYLSRVCPASPVKLRLCEPGENGSVIQAYEYYQEDQPYEWNVVPLNIYLYGVADPGNRPLFGSPELRRLLQEQYRRSYMQGTCTNPACITNNNANWRDAVAAAFVREIYIFEVRTTVEQDEQFIRTFNARPNVNHYSGFKRNCADFAKLVVNTYFPHSAHRDFLNDFGMTGPKAIARTFSHYAEKHPELEFHVIRIEQVPGTYKRSSDCHEGTEQMFRSKKWVVPLAVIGLNVVAFHGEPLIAASYLLTGQFNPDHELRNWPSENAALLHSQIAEAKAGGDATLARELKADLYAERARQLGDQQEWQQYRDRFEEILKTAIDDGVVSGRRQIDGLFRELEANGHVYLDENGQPWLELGSSEALRRVGLSPDNIFSAESDNQFAMQLLLARTNALLSLKPNHRGEWKEFQSDWALLQRAEQAMMQGGGHTTIATRAARP